MSVDKKFRAGVRRVFARNVALAVLMASGLSLGIAGSASAVVPYTITQVSPLTGSVTTPLSTGVSTQLNVTGNSGAVTYTTVAGPVDVSSTGLVTVPSILATGIYTVSGFTNDTSAGTGTYTFQLTVITGTMGQAAPTSATTTTPASAGWVDQLNVTGSSGTVSYSTNAGPINVSASGHVSTSGTLAKGIYTVSGTTSDTNGDSGSYNYQLTVNAGSGLNVTPINLVVPITNPGGTIAAPTTSGFSQQLTVTNGVGADAFAQTSAPAGLSISATGLVTSTGALTLADGVHTISGTVQDTNTAGTHDTGTFSFSIDVIAGQLPDAFNFAITDTLSSTLFTDTVGSPAGSFGTVTFSPDSQTSCFGGNQLQVDSTGAVSTTGPLCAGVYDIFDPSPSGITDANGSWGGWEYQLLVFPITLTQNGNVANGSTVTPFTSTAWTDTITATGDQGTGVTYSQTGSDSACLNVDTSGDLTVSCALAVGFWTVSGNTSDPLGDSGSFSYTLHVTAGVLTQVAPTSDTVTSPNSPFYFNFLNVNGSPGFVDFSSFDNGSISVYFDGLVLADTVLPTGNYTATGTTSDGYGDSGTYTFTLHVTVGTLVQVSPTSDYVSTQYSGTYTNNLNIDTWYGSLAFSPVVSGPLHVSSSGQVTTSGSLAAGPYTVNGTVIDSNGNTGPYTFNLLVVPTLIQLSPVAGVVTPPASSTFSQQLFVTGNANPVTWSNDGGTSALTVSASGVISVVGGPLAIGPYTKYLYFQDPVTLAYGFGQYTLTVGAATIVQTTPVSFTGDPISAQSYNAQLNTTGGTGPVTFTKTSADPTLAVSSSGHLNVAVSGLTAGVYTVSGTTADAFGDSGTFSFTLTVTGTGGGILPGPVPTVPILIINASSESVAAGAAVNETASVAGLATGDTATVTGVVFTYTGIGGTTYGPSQSTPTSAGTYSVTPSSGTVTVTPAAHQANYSPTHLYGNGTLTVSGSVAKSSPHISSTSGKVVHGKTTTLILHGSGFGDGAKFKANKAGFKFTVFSLNTGRVSLTVTASATLKAGTYRVFLTNPDGGSTSITFKVS